MDEENKEETSSDTEQLSPYENFYERKRSPSPEQEDGTIELDINEALDDLSADLPRANLMSKSNCIPPD